MTCCFQFDTVISKIAKHQCKPGNGECDRKE